MKGDGGVRVAHNIFDLPVAHRDWGKLRPYPGALMPHKTSDLPTAHRDWGNCGHALGGSYAPQFISMRPELIVF